MFQKELYSYIPNVTVWRVTETITPLSVKVFVTLATQWHLECSCKALFETPCITIESYIEQECVIYEYLPNVLEQSLEEAAILKDWNVYFHCLRSETALACIISIQGQESKLDYKHDISCP
jgi:hypothetical protein